MAAKKQKAQKTVVVRSAGDSEAKFPYTTKPASLRRLLKEIPKKPKPSKFDKDLLRSWGFGDTNDLTMIRVLKAVQLLNDRNEPTDLYSRFMNMNDGAKALGPEVKRVYAPLFEASLSPFQEGNDKLQNLFNIHSGGGDRSLDFQIQTFKALCENASFDAAPSNAMPTIQSSGAASGTTAGVSSSLGGPIVNINLHIHLPENKSRRDYEDIIEDIGRYIFGRDVGGRRE
jgi:hypothetical protein